MIETITRTEWLERNPTLKKYIASNPVGWSEVPAFTLWPDATQIDGISEHQRENLSKAMGGRIGILGGSPGTGKTYTVAKLIAHLLDSGLVAEHDIGIGAPTGKAAVRLTEMLQSNGLPLRARTWHSLLGIGNNSETGGWSFAHNENNHFGYRLLIGDESSMLDLSLALAVFRARAPGCHVLLVGDVNQLPPVGNGAPLRDLIAAGLPYGELREIKRNSGGIVEACAAIRDCQPWTQFADKPGTNLRITNSSDPESKLERVLEIIDDSERDGNDPIWDCQVLVAVNESSPLSRCEVNKVLQDKLNPGPKFEGTKFKPRDKVVCLKNGFYKSLEPIIDEDIRTNDRDEVYVANGELAEVIGIEGNDIAMRLSSPARVISIPIRRQNNNETESESNDAPSGQSANWDLGYALSVHKSQGSEWPITIVVLDAYPGARMICDRAWLYTAISRGRSITHLVGTKDLADRFCRVQKIEQRKTFLKELINREMFRHTIDEL